MLGISKITLRLRYCHSFMWQSLEILSVLNTVILKKIFEKAKAFFKKLETCFLVESTKIENATFPYKTALSKANVKTNKMRHTKWTNHKEGSFASIYFNFLKILFHFKNLLLGIGFMYHLSKCAIHTSLKRWSFIGFIFKDSVNTEIRIFCWSYF